MAASSPPLATVARACASRWKSDSLAVKSLQSCQISGLASVVAPVSEPFGKPSSICCDSHATRSARLPNWAASNGTSPLTMAPIGPKFQPIMA